MSGVERPLAGPPDDAALPVLVTGAGGFLGGAVVRAFAAHGASVAAVGRDPTRLPRGPRVIPLVGRLDDPAVWRAAPRTRAVLHFAYASDLRGRADAETIAAADLAMTAAAVAIARRDDAPMLLASTGSLYGAAHRPFVEDDPTDLSQDIDGYLAAKLACESLVVAELPPDRRLIARFFFAYGPGARAGSLFDRLLRPTPGGRPVALDGENGLLTNPIHIDDAAEGARRLIEAGARGVVNLGGPEIIALRAFGDRAAQLGGWTPRYVHIPPHRPPMLAGALDRLTALTGWRPALDVETGLRRALSVSSQAPARSADLMAVP